MNNDGIKHYVSANDPNLEYIGRKHLFGSRVSSSDIGLMIEGLGAMMEAGIPLVDSLDVTRSQTRNPYLRDVLYISRKIVEGGRPLHYAWGFFPDIFDPVTIAIIKAGELSGTIVDATSYIAGNLEASEELKQKTLAASIYPAFILATLFGVMGFMLIAVVPRIANIYKESGETLPFLTTFVIWLSDIVTSWYCAVIIGVLIVISIVTIKLFEKPERKIVWHKILLKIPVISPILKETALATLTRTLSLVLKSGVPILESLDIVSSTMGNLMYKEAITKIRKSVERGQSISATIVQDKDIYPSLFIPLSVSVIAVGEKSGNLPESLMKLSLMLKKKVEKSIQLMYTFIEPVLLIVIGVIVATMVLSVTLPIYQLPATIEMS